MERSEMKKIENKEERNEIRYAPDVNDITAKVKMKLERLGTNKWAWKDTKEIAKNVEDLILQDIAPNYECVSYYDATYVNIPKNWNKSISDPDVLNAINSLLALPSTKLITVHGIYPELTQVYQVDTNEWDKIMKRPIGVRWVMSDSEFMALLETGEGI